MVSSVDSESPKKNDGALNRPATDRVQGRGMPALFTDEVLHRLEAGLRAQREQQEGRRFHEPDAASSRPGNSSALRGWLNESAPIEPMSAAAPLALLPFWRRRMGALVLCALLLVAGGATVGGSLKARTGASALAPPVNIEGQTPAPDNDAPPNAVRSSAATPSLPPPSPNGQPVEAHGSPAVSGTPGPPNEHSVEARGPVTPAERPVEAPAGTSAPPEAQAPAAASGTPATKPKCNVAACRRFYRSFRASDCTFQPHRGKRRICDR